MKKILLSLFFVSFLTGVAYADTLVYRWINGQNADVVNGTNKVLTNPTGSSTHIVRVVAKGADMLFTSETTNPIATNATGHYIMNGIPELIQVNPNEYMAVMATGASGVVYIDEGTH